MGWGGSSEQKKSFFNHSANTLTSYGPMSCILETNTSITIEKFQEFIDALTCPGFCLNALINICKLIDTSLIKGQTPYPMVFSCKNQSKDGW